MAKRQPRAARRGAQRNATAAPRRRGRRPGTAAAISAAQREALHGLYLEGGMTVTRASLETGLARPKVARAFAEFGEAQAAEQDRPFARRWEDARRHELEALAAAIARNSDEIRVARGRRALLTGEDGEPRGEDGEEDEGMLAAEGQIRAWTALIHTLEAHGAELRSKFHVTEAAVPPIEALRAEIRREIESERLALTGPEAEDEG